MRAKLGYHNITFAEQEDSIRLTLLEHFIHDIPRSTLEAIAPVHVEEGDLVFEGISEKKAENKFFRILDHALRNLYSTATKKPVSYVHSESGIPLMGCIAFGIVDRGTDMLEIKPLTGCNINCIFCSVDEGISSKKTTDIVVEADYLIEETRKLLEFKEHNGVDIYLNPHGDPTLYADLVYLVKGLRTLPQVRVVTMITNAQLLTQEKIDELIKAGLNRINISISATDELEGKKAAGWGQYDVKHVMNMVEYCSERIETFIGPVYLPGVNEQSIEDVVAWAKHLNVTIGIQNFLPYKGGRNPVKGVSMEKFFEFLKRLEEKYEVNLTSFDYELIPTKELPMQFKKNDVVRAEIVLPGRYAHEKIGKAGDRCITIRNCTQESGTLKVKIIKAKNNLFTAIPL
ncbi:radical SAM protein [Candidatus Woesearchaeota archaeon]|nr:MAG: radical SAM protein [Candidatus Woesearchaeota archaeon]